MCRPNYGHSLDTVIICIIDCLCCFKNGMVVYSRHCFIYMYLDRFCCTNNSSWNYCPSKHCISQKVAISFKITQKDNASCKTDKNTHNKTSCLRSYVSTHFIQCSLLFCLYFSTIARLDWQNHSNERFYGCKQAK